MPDDAKEIQHKNKELIAAAIKQLEIINYDTVAELIPSLLEKGSLKLDHVVYTPTDSLLLVGQGIGRYLLYDHQDTDHPFSIWIFALGSRQKTCIHDHQYRGTVTVLSESISEKYYLPTSENTARCIGRADRYRFHSTLDELKDNFVHQLKRRKNLGDGVSVTLHIYEMAAQQINEEGVSTDNRNLYKIYLKDKHVDEDGTAPHKENYQQLHNSSYQP